MFGKSLKSVGCDSHFSVLQKCGHAIHSVPTVSKYTFVAHTIFPHIVSEETILFWIWKLKEIQIVAANFNFLPNKLNFCWGNYSREETIQGRKLYEEIRELCLHIHTAYLYLECLLNIQIGISRHLNSSPIIMVKIKIKIN